MDAPTNRQLLIKINAHILKLKNKIDIIDKRTESYPKLYDNVDKLIGEIVENRQERAFINKRIKNHEKRLSTLEGHH